MKSERQAARIALVCFAVGRFGATAKRGAGGAAAGMAIAAGGGTAAGGAVAGGAAATEGALEGKRTALWQAGESAALARRHSRSSGLPGWIQEQCDMKSLIVQACWTAASSSCCDGWEGCGEAASAAAGCGVSGFVSGVVSALGTTALPHSVDNCAALRSRHCSASRPPGCTPEQWVMKSERQACRHQPAE
jgi:hypothetical protein